MRCRVAAFGHQYWRQQHFYLFVLAFTGKRNQSVISINGIIKTETGKPVDYLPAKVALKISTVNVRVLVENIRPQETDMVPPAHSTFGAGFLFVQCKRQEPSGLCCNIRGIDIIGTVKVAEDLRKERLYRSRHFGDLLARASQPFIELLQRVVADAQSLEQRLFSQLDHSIVLR